MQGSTPDKYIMTHIQMDATFKTVTLLLWSLLLACRIGAILASTTDGGSTAETTATTTTTTKATTVSTTASSNSEFFTNQMIIGLATGFGVFVGIVFCCCVVWCCCGNVCDDGKKKKVMPAGVDFRTRAKLATDKGHPDDRRQLKSASTISTNSRS